MNQILAIQSLRAVAALMIVVLHAAHDATLLSQKAGGSFALPAWPLSAGVDLFFVISGFVMVVSSRHLFGQPDQRRVFFGRRIARIVPIYWLMTAAFLAILALRPETLNSAAPTVTEIVKSALFIPYVKPADGLMQPVFKLGWTLNYEMMFYLVFGLALALPARKAVLAVSAVMVMLATAGLVFMPETAPLAFWTQPIILEFVIGLWIGLARLEGLRLGPAIAGMLLVLALALFALAPTDIAAPAGLERLIAWGVPSALVIAAAALWDRPFAAEHPATRALSALGDASYALYLGHPFAIRLTSVLFERLGLTATLGPMTLVLVATLLAIALALLLHAFFERPVTERLQTWLGVGKVRRTTLPAPNHAMS